MGYAIQPSGTHYEQPYEEYDYYDEYYPPAQTCKFYGSAVGCRNGDTCYYSHDNPESIQPCVEFQTQGSCKFEGKCHRRHAPANTDDKNDDKNENKTNSNVNNDTKYETVCRYFSNDGQCAAGVHCRFKHTSTANGVSTAATTHCMYFNSTAGCKFGDKCRFLHPKSDGVAGVDVKPVVTVVKVEDELNGKDSIEHLMKKLNLGIVSASSAAVVVVEVVDEVRDVVVDETTNTDVLDVD